MSAVLNSRGRPILPSIAIKFEYMGQRYNARVTRHPNGRPAEIYLDGGLTSNTAARLASLLLSLGVDIPTIRIAALTGPLCVVLDRIIAMMSSTAENSAVDTRADMQPSTAANAAPEKRATKSAE
jgi:hypothetical protein